MFFKNLAYSITLPFKNLTTQARTVQIYRLVSGLIALVLVVITLTGSLISNKMYIARIDCSHIDVSLGLYESLRSTVSANDVLESLTSYYLPQDQSLTDSEIKILTTYAQEQVASAPQFITTSLWSWCYGNYNVTTVDNFEGTIEYERKDYSMQCSKSKDGFAFDYKNVLSDVGLNSIIAYAYTSDRNTEKSYQDVARSRKHKYKMVPAALVFCAASQLIVFVFTYLVYSNRGSQKDLTKIHPLFLNLVAFASLASCLSIVVGAVIITNLLIQIRNEISSQLNSFGIALHFGSIWFSFLWTAFVFSFLSMTSWAFPLWCANPQDIDDEEFATYNEHVQSANRAASTSSKNVRKNNSYKRFTSQDASILRENSIEGSSSEEGSFIRSSVQVHPGKNEDELRKLGETLSRKTSVRQIKRYSKSRKHRLSTLFDDETVDLLYNDTNENEPGNYYNAPGRLHYQEETFDGYTDGNLYGGDFPLNYNSFKNNNFQKSRSKTDEVSNSRYLQDPFLDNSASNKERIFSHYKSFPSTANSNSAPNQSESNNTSKELYTPCLDVPNSNKERVFSHNATMYHLDNNLVNKRHSQEDSILNDEEMNILDLNDYVERL